MLSQVKVVSGKYSGITARIEERDVRKGMATVLLRSASSFYRLGTTVLGLGTKTNGAGRKGVEKEHERSL